MKLAQDLDVAVGMADVAVPLAEARVSLLTALQSPTTKELHLEALCKALKAPEKAAEAEGHAYEPSQRAGTQRVQLVGPDSSVLAQARLTLRFLAPLEVPEQAIHALSTFSQVKTSEPAAGTGGQADTAPIMGKGLPRFAAIVAEQTLCLCSVVGRLEQHVQSVLEGGAAVQTAVDQTILDGVAGALKDLSPDIVGSSHFDQDKQQEQEQRTALSHWVHGVQAHMYRVLTSLAAHLSQRDLIITAATEAWSSLCPDSSSCGAVVPIEASGPRLAALAARIKSVGLVGLDKYSNTSVYTTEPEADTRLPPWESTWSKVRTCLAPRVSMSPTQSASAASTLLLRLQSSLDAVMPHIEDEIAEHRARLGGPPPDETRSADLQGCQQRISVLLAKITREILTYKGMDMDAQSVGAILRQLGAMALARISNADPLNTPPPGSEAAHQQAWLTTAHQLSSQLHVTAAWWMHCCMRLCVPGLTDMDVSVALADTQRFSGILAAGVDALGNHALDQVHAVQARVTELRSGRIYSLQSVEACLPVVLAQLQARTVAAVVSPLLAALEWAPAVRGGDAGKQQGADLVRDALASMTAWPQRLTQAVNAVHTAISAVPLLDAPVQDALHSVLQTTDPHVQSLSSLVARLSGAEVLARQDQGVQTTATDLEAGHAERLPADKERANRPKDGQHEMPLGGSPCDHDGQVGSEVANVTHDHQSATVTESDQLGGEVSHVHDLGPQDGHGAGMSARVLDMHQGAAVEDADDGCSTASEDYELGVLQLHTRLLQCNHPSHPAVSATTVHGQ